MAMYVSPTQRAKAHSPINISIASGENVTLASDSHAVKQSSPKISTPDGMAIDRSFVHPEKAEFGGRPEFNRQNRIARAETEAVNDLNPVINLHCRTTPKVTKHCCILAVQKTIVHRMVVLIGRIKSNPGQTGVREATPGDLLHQWRKANRFE
jgi:hypothetical protein